MSDVKIQAPIKVDIKVICTDGEGSFGEVTFELPVMQYPTKESIDEAIKEISEGELLKANGLRIASQRETWDYIIRERTGSDTAFAMPCYTGESYWDEEE